MTKKRLQKIISESGLSSRRQAERLLNENRVTINGKVAKVGDKADLNIDLVLVDGNKINIQRDIKVIILNKPKGILSTCSDELKRKTVIDLMPNEIRKGLYPIGRLDRDSKGLILLTNHGDLALKLTHPRYEHIKTYKVSIKGYLSTEKLIHWEKGVLLDGIRTKEACIKFISKKNNTTNLEIKIREGRKRQIRRIAELLGHPVIELKRTEFAGIKLGSLKEGHYRKLGEDEKNNLVYKSNNNNK
tara:strand:+ start:2132 stop:2866 length:735 start_codon:yes stop_codon:yes gene_type:complete